MSATRTRRAGGHVTGLYWTRERAGSGPADTLNTRWHVRRVADSATLWEVYDSRNRQVVAGPHRTMREASQAAEQIVRDKYRLGAR